MNNQKVILLEKDNSGWTPKEVDILIRAGCEVETLPSKPNRLVILYLPTGKTPGAILDFSEEFVSHQVDYANRWF